MQKPHWYEQMIGSLNCKRKIEFNGYTREISPCSRQSTTTHNEHLITGVVC